MNTGNNGERVARIECERQVQAAEVIMNAAGGPVWVVLDVDLEHGRVLFISRDIIAQEQYHGKYKDITWADCSLRLWLNGSFFSSLPTQIKRRVIEVTIQNPANKQYNTIGGKPTRDRVFLLSLDEVNQYFNGNDSRVARFNGVASWWWLRSPGFNQRNAAGVSISGSIGGSGSNVVRVGGGVRPALFFNLDA